MVETTRRLKKFEVSVQVLALMAEEGAVFQIDEGVPDDAEIADAGYDEDRRLFYLTLAHESFEEVGEAQEIPHAEITITELTLDGAIEE